MVVLVERGGNVRAMPMERIDRQSMERGIRTYVESGSRLVTDETAIYSSIRVKGEQQMRAWSARRSTSSGEFVRGEVHTNTARASSRC